MKDFHILEALESDIPECASLIVRTDNLVCEQYGFEKNLNSDGAVERLKDDLFTGGHVFKGVCNGKIVSTVTVKHIGYEKKSFELCRLAVHPDYQRQGLGQKHLDHAVSYIGRNGGTCIFCAFPHQNVIVKDWLEKNDFFLDGFYQLQDFPCEICIMQKAIVPADVKSCNSGSCASCGSCG